MRVMIDTNILISAVLFPSGKASMALQKALIPPHHPLISDYILDELRRKFEEKFSDSMSDLDTFLEAFLLLVEVVKTPALEDDKEGKIRDPKDRPILRAAINSKADLLLTGDKDFLESGVDNPKIISASEFLDM